MEWIKGKSASSLRALLIMLVALTAFAGVSKAQTTATHISADGAPYHITWDGQKGMLVRDVLGRQPELRMPLVFLHTDPGPRGYAKYLAWFLARDGNSFSILWRYLNDLGDDFYCWLYAYPSNQLSSVEFVGKYVFNPPVEPLAPSPITNLPVVSPPRYSGPDFTYRDWTRNSGLLATLDLRSATRSTLSSDTGAQAVLDSGKNTPPVRTLTNLRVFPLEEVRVEGGNGWGVEGWRELHCLAYDSSGAPYYLILYSNTPRGYVIDLKQAQTFVTDYGQTVAFREGQLVFGMREDRVTGPPELHVRRFTRQEIDMVATGTYMNPYTEVLIEGDFTGPDGSKLTVPGYWDGGTVWKIRFAPKTIGKWTWRTRSNDTGLNSQNGQFTCVADSSATQGFLKVDTGSHSFTYSDDTPFMPVMVVYPFWRYVHPVSHPPVTGSTVETLDAEFQTDVDHLAALGFNRFIGSYLFDKGQILQNEGGEAFLGGDPDALNPAFFQALDNRLAYCNSKKIVPDIGIGMLNSDLFSKVSEAQMRRLWRYVLARYAGYQVCWNLFGREVGSQTPIGSDAVVASLADLTHRMDPIGHPLTLVMPGSAASSTIRPPAVTTETTASASDYLVSPAGMSLWPDSSSRLAQEAAAAMVAGSLTPGADARWLSVITLNGGNLEAITADYRYGKPIVILDQSAPPNPDTNRRRLWETRMQGGFWASGIPGAGSTPAVNWDSPLMQWEVYYGRLFHATRFWRLMPHNDLLQPATGSAVVTAIGSSTAASITVKTDTGPVSAQPPSRGIYLLADPAWEYVVYFEHGGTVTLDLLEATGNLNVVWFNPRTGESQPATKALGGGIRTFQAPDTNDWVLHLTRL